MGTMKDILMQKTVYNILFAVTALSYALLSLLFFTMAYNQLINTNYTEIPLLFISIGAASFAISAVFIYSLKQKIKL